MLFFSMHDHREHRRQTKAQSLSIPLLCIVVQRQGCTLFSSLTQAFLSRALKYIQIYFLMQTPADWNLGRNLVTFLHVHSLCSSAAALLGAALPGWGWAAERHMALGWALPAAVVRNLSYARPRELMHCLFKNNIFLQECCVISVVIQQCLLGEGNSFLRSWQRSCSLQWTAVRVQGMAWRQGRHRGDLLRWGGYLFLAAPFPAVSS